MLEFLIKADYCIFPLTSAPSITCCRDPQGAACQLVPGIQWAFSVCWSAFSGFGISLKTPSYYKD